MRFAGYYRSQPGNVANQPQVPSTGDPGHRYGPQGSAAALPGPSIKGKFYDPVAAALASPKTAPKRLMRTVSNYESSYSVSGQTPYQPTLKKPEKVQPTNRTVSPGRLTPQFSGALNGLESVSENESTRSKSPSLSSASGSLHPLTMNANNFSPRAALQQAYNQQQAFASPQLRIPKFPQSARIRKTAWQASFREEMEPDGGGESTNEIFASIPTIADDLQSMSGTDSLASTPMGNNRSFFSRTKSDKSLDGARDNGSFVIVNGKIQSVTKQSVHQEPSYESLVSEDNSKFEKLDLVISHLRSVLEDDANEHVQDSHDDLFFPTRFPRNQALVDIRQKCLQSIRIWEHAVKETIDRLDKVCFVYLWV